MDVLEGTMRISTMILRKRKGQQSARLKMVRRLIAFDAMFWSMIYTLPSMPLSLLIIAIAW